MVQPIGPTNPTKVKTNDFNVDAVRQAAQNAYATYGNPDPTQHSEYMRVFYTEGKKNPCVSMMILRDAITEGYSKEIGASKEAEKPLRAAIRAVQQTDVAIPSQNIEKGNKVAGAYAEMCRVSLFQVGKLSAALNTNMEDRLQGAAKSAQAEFEKEFKALYPKTYLVRQRLVNEQFVTKNRKTAPKRSEYVKERLLRPEEPVAQDRRGMVEVLEDLMLKPKSKPKPKPKPNLLNIIFSWVKKVKL